MRVRCCKVDRSSNEFTTHVTIISFVLKLARLISVWNNFQKNHTKHISPYSLESLQLLSTVIPNPWSLICWNVASRKRKLPFVYQLISISSMVENKRTSICFNSLELQEYDMCMHSWIWFLQMELYTSNSMMRCTSQNILVFAPNKCKLE